MGKSKKDKSKESPKKTTTKEEWEQFASEMRLMLTMNNYGFAKSDRSRPSGSGVVTFDNVTQLKAIKELKTRLVVFVATGKTDIGHIDFPECNRRIDYALVGDNINRCSIRLHALSNEQPYIFE